MHAEGEPDACVGSLHGSVPFAYDVVGGNDIVAVGFGCSVVAGTMDSPSLDSLEAY